MTRKAKTFLYNCKIDGDHYRITKFDAHFDVEASYLCTEEECECPAGERPSCRHRQMLPKFQAHKATKGQMFFDYDREMWLKAELDVEFEVEVEVEVEAHETTDHMPTSDPMPTEPPHAFGPDLPPGIVMLDLADIGAAHNAIAEAVGEPTITTKIAPFAKRDRRI